MIKVKISQDFTANVIADVVVRETNVNLNTEDIVFLRTLYGDVAEYLNSISIPVQLSKCIVLPDMKTNNSKQIYYVVCPDDDIADYNVLFICYYEAIKSVIDSNYHSLVIPLLNAYKPNRLLHTCIDNSLGAFLQAVDACKRVFRKYELSICLCVAPSSYEYISSIRRIGFISSNNHTLQPVNSNKSDLKSSISSDYSYDEIVANLEKTITANSQQSHYILNAHRENSGLRLKSERDVVAKSAMSRNKVQKKANTNGANRKNKSIRLNKNTVLKLISKEHPQYTEAIEAYLKNNKMANSELRFLYEMAKEQQPDSKKEFVNQYLIEIIYIAYNYSYKNEKDFDETCQNAVVGFYEAISSCVSKDLSVFDKYYPKLIKRYLDKYC